MIQISLVTWMMVIIKQQQLVKWEMAIQHCTYLELLDVYTTSFFPANT